MTPHPCARILATGMSREQPCPHPAKVERDGQWFCGYHDPVAVAREIARRKDVFEAKRKASDIQRRVEAV